MGGGKENLLARGLLGRKEKNGEQREGGRGAILKLKVIEFLRKERSL